MRLSAVAALTAVLAIPALAGDTVELKPNAQKGAKWTRSHTVSGEGTVTVDMGEQKMESPCTMGTEEKQAEEVLEAKDGKVTKLKRYYTKKRDTMEMSAFGHSEKKDEKYVGKIITIEKTDAGLKAACEGFTADDLKGETLEDDDASEAISPGKPVSVGDSWDADPEKVKKWMNEKGDKDLDSATLHCTLSAVEEKFGQKCAKIAVKLEMKGVSGDGAKKNNKLTVTFEGPVWFGLDTGRPLGMDLKGKMTMSGPVPNGKGSMTMDLDLKLQGEAKVGEADFTAEPEKGGDEEEGGDEDGDDPGMK